ncbi:HAMP domain-containing histidine kinase [Rheinheimera riviphila]|uniref:histidine kinase n=1 Tax=Rheinheimera riviphila TaxID=1834037 RepID=A0A437QZJ1_9GAMM|nr:HAMP domain-containing sensor histidine kinase [Rheinheimera riviphila]RVU39945.1 HAMP domain-containing histidine kinase [Rheinheimera riviphila]
MAANSTSGFSLKLTGKLLVVITVILVSCQLLMSGFYWVTNAQKLQQAHQQHLQQLQITLGQTIAIDVWNFNPGSLEVLLKPYLNDEAIKAITVRDMQQNQLTLPRTAGNPAPATARSSQPLFLTIAGNNEQIGQLQIIDDITYIHQELRQNLQRQFTELLIMLVLLAIGLTFTLHLLVLRPLCKLHHALMEAIQNKTDTVQNPLLGLHDEFEEVAAGMVALSDRLSGDMQQILQSQTALMAAKEKTEQALQDLKQTQEALLQSEKQASLGALVSGVAHEVNTPLGIIITSVTCMHEQLHRIHKDMTAGKLTRQVLQDNVSSLLEAAQLITHNADRASQLVTNFKLLAKEQSTEAERSFDLSAYLTEVLQSLQPQLAKAHIELQMQLEPKITLVGMPGLFHQVLSTMVSNVIQHAYPRGEGGYCKVELYRQNQFLMLALSDGGQGIEHDQLKHVFDPFYTTQLGTGTSGLGLAIVHRIVRSNLCGQISVQSREQEGTRFEIQIPA